MNEHIVGIVSDAVQRHYAPAANKCGCVTPALSWAARTWSARATAWLHVEPHDLEVDGKDIVYHVNGYENGFKIFGRTLSQMTDTRAEDYRGRCVKEAMAALDRL